MDVVRQFLMMAAGLIITVSLIIIGYNIFDGAVNIGNKIVSSEQETLQRLEEDEIYMYEGLDITGTKVINYVEKMYLDHGIDVSITNAFGTFSVSELENISALRDTAGIYYLSPVKKYRISVTCDNNGEPDVISVVITE